MAAASGREGRGAPPMSEHDVMPGAPQLDEPLGQPQAISLDEVTEIAGEVRELIEAGEEYSAWARLRLLHPADTALILAGLPRASTATLLRVMSPESVAWMLNQMNPVEAGRLGRRLGSRMLSPVLRQIQPQQALATLRRLPTLRLRELRERAARSLSRHCRADPRRISRGQRAARSLPRHRRADHGGPVPLGRDRRTGRRGTGESARTRRRAGRRAARFDQGVEPC